MRLTPSRSAVSTIIPAHEAEYSIQRALDSVYAQTYDNIIEVIVVDDGSEDNTAEIVREKYQDVTLIQQENAGAGAARNTGLEAATGEYIAFLDADDEWLPTRIERQMRIIAQNPDVDLCGCLFEVVTGQGRRRRTRQERVGATTPVHFRDYLSRKVRVGIAPIGPRVAFLEIGGFDIEMPSFEEFDLWLRLLASGRTIVILQECLYRWHIQSESRCHGHQGLRRHDAALQILDRWDPTRHPDARELLTEEEHARWRARALLAASRDHAYYGEDEKARSYAQQALAMEGGSVVDRLCLQGLARVPAAHRAWARAIDGGKSVARRFLR